MSSQVRSPSGVDRVLCLGSLKAKIKVPARLGSHLGRIHFQAHSGYWENSVPCSYRPGVPVSFLAVSPEPLSQLLKASRIPSHMAPSIKPATTYQVPPVLQIFLPSNSAVTQRKVCFLILI